MSWEALCGDGWTLRLVGWLGAKLMYAAFVNHVAHADSQQFLWATVVDFVGAFIATVA